MSQLRKESSNKIFKFINWLGTEEDTDFFRISDEISQVYKLNTRVKFTFYPAAKAVYSAATKGSYGPNSPWCYVCSHVLCIV